MAGLLAAVAHSLIALCSWALSRDVADLTAIVTLLTTALSAVLAVVAVAAAGL